MIASSLLAATVHCGGAIGALPPADKLQVSATVMTGTGVSLAGNAKKTYASRTPTFLLGEVGFVHPGLDWLEFAPTVMLEVEGRVGFGLMPKLRARLPGKRVRAWGLVAMPVYVTPYTLLGVQVGVGVSVALHRRLALVAEATGGAYVWGSDLMANAALGQLDLTLGLRVNF
ncbi:MAG: hypothetical protein K1X88_20700 [Nannocystaceae bacterium]|nr:hypothetical protein [Nannocystaceae bacterium]